MRTIEELRNNIEGKIYIRLNNEEIGKRFLEDAEKEGYKFGSIKPTDNHWSDIVAVETDKQLSYVGAMGRIGIQCQNGAYIDYEKYTHGENDYIIKC